MVLTHDILRKKTRISELVVQSRGIVMKPIVSVLCLIVVFSATALAEESSGQSAISRRGLVTSSSCPFSCLDLGLSADKCRQWTSGSKCYVEDYTQPAGHRSMVRVKPEQYIAPSSKKQSPRSALNRRGLVTSSRCPYDCRHTGLTKDLCREWRAGNTCYTEDFTQVPGHRTMIRVPR